MYVWHETHLLSAFNAWTAVAIVILAVMLHGVWRLWRGMRLDAFERGLRQLREQPLTAVRFGGARPASPSQAGWFQISLLPLMLLSCALALLLAQAQRPDDVSRPVTWALFVVVGAWYGTRSWSYARGVGPLRGFALAGVCSATCISALLWGFYLAVDTWWGGVSVQRLTATVPTLLWWTAVGGVLGGLIGAWRAERVYDHVRAETDDVQGPQPAVAEVVVRPVPRSRKLQWTVVAMACTASLLFHCSAAPHLYRVVEYRYWVWDWSYYHRPSPAMTLTMAPVSARAAASDDDALRFTNIANVAVSDPDVQRGPRFSRRDRPREFKVVDAIVPKHDIAQGQVITREMLTVVSMEVAATDSLVEFRGLVGNISVDRLPAGQPIREAQLTWRSYTPSTVLEGFNPAVMVDSDIPQVADVNEPKGDIPVERSKRVASDLPFSEPPVTDVDKPATAAKEGTPSFLPLIETYSYDPPVPQKVSGPEFILETEVEFDTSQAEVRPNVMQSPKVKLYNGPEPKIEPAPPKPVEPVASGADGADIIKINEPLRSELVPGRRLRPADVVAMASQGEQVSQTSSPVPAGPRRPAGPVPAGGTADLDPSFRTEVNSLQLPQVSTPASAATVEPVEPIEPIESGGQRRQEEPTADAGRPVALSIIMKTQDGRILIGVLAGRTDESLTLKLENDQVVRVATNNVDSLFEVVTGSPNEVPSALRGFSMRPIELSDLPAALNP